METVVLIACSGTKIACNEPVAAEQLYAGQLFKKSLAYAKSIGADKIFILSAKYHLLELDQKINYYDTYLKSFDKKSRKEWSKKILDSLKSKIDIDNTHFIILAGNLYCSEIIKNFKHYERPLINLRIGEQLSKLTNLTQNSRIFKIKK